MPRMRPARRWLYVATWHMDFCVGLFSFAMTRSLAERGVGLPVLGLLGGVSAIMWAAASLVGGRMADRLGRRQVVRVGAAVVFVAAATGTLLHACTPITVGAWWLSSLGAGAFYPALLAWLNQGRGGSAEGRRRISRSVIRFCVAWNLGLVSGQLSGGALFRLGPQWPLSLAALAGALNLLVVLRIGGGELPPPAAAVLEAVDARHQELSAAFARLCWIANLGGTFVVGIILNLLPDLMVELGIPPGRHGLMLGAMRAVIIATYFLMHRTQFWHYRISFPLVSHAFAVVGLFLLSIARGGMGLALGMCGLGVMFGFNYFASLYYSSTGAADHAKGRASGLHEATLGLGIAGGAIIGGISSPLLGSRGPYRLAAVLIAALAITQLVVFLRRR